MPKLYNMASIFSVIVSTRLWNDLDAFKRNPSDILFHSSSKAVLSEQMFGSEVTFALFSKMPDKS